MSKQICERGEMVDALVLEASVLGRGGSTPLARTKLFLDDIRDPPDSSWTVVRSYAEAVAFVVEYGFPDRVSFDHDLGDDLTGLDFAHYLVDLDLDKAAMPDNFTYSVHSANPVGFENITGLMNGYMRWKHGNV